MVKNTVINTQLETSKFLFVVTWMLTWIYFTDKDSCGGDSGGPVVYRPNINSNFHQVGIVSFGSRICGKRIPGVYTKISSFLNWIDDNLEE